MGNPRGTQERTAVRRRATGAVQRIHHEESQVADERLAQGEHDCGLLLLLNILELLFYVSLSVLTAIFHVDRGWPVPE